MKTNGNEGTNRNMFSFEYWHSGVLHYDRELDKETYTFFPPKDLLKILKKLWPYIIIPTPVINTGYGCLPVHFIQGE